MKFISLVKLSSRAATLPVIIEELDRRLLWQAKSFDSVNAKSAISYHDNVPPGGSDGCRDPRVPQRS